MPDLNNLIKQNEMMELLFVAVLVGLIVLKALAAQNRQRQRQEQQGQSGHSQHGENFPFPQMTSLGFPSFPDDDSNEEMPSGRPSGRPLWRGSEAEVLDHDFRHNQEGAFVASTPNIMVPLQGSVGTAESMLQPQFETTDADVDAPLSPRNDNFKAKDFDLRTAIIYHEIIEPKYKEY